MTALIRIQCDASTENVAREFYMACPPSLTVLEIKNFLLRATPLHTLGGDSLPANTQLGNMTAANVTVRIKNKIDTENTIMLPDTMTVRYDVDFLSLFSVRMHRLLYLCCCAVRGSQNASLVPTFFRHFRDAMLKLEDYGEDVVFLWSFLH
jgi:hypothetical protein